MDDDEHRRDRSDGPVHRGAHARDTDELTDLVAEDAQFRTAGGKALIGHDGVEKLVTAARATGVMLRRLGDEMVTEEGDTVKVVAPST